MERGTNQNKKRYKNQLNIKMKLNDTNLFIKDNLQNIIDGKFDDKFEPNQLKMMLEMSFLYNHITFELTDSILFKYNDISYKVKGIKEMIDSIIFVTNFKTSSPYNIDVENEIFGMIRNAEVFKSSYKQFLRDTKINKILN